MRVEFGAHVRSSDDREVGIIDRLILDPASDDLKAVAIRQGLLLTHDIEVPVTALTAGPDDALRLTVPAARVHEFPRFVESHYTEAPPATLHAVGTPTHLLPGGYLYALPEAEQMRMTSEVSEQLVQMFSEQDLANAVVGEGSAVRDRHGRTVGHLHELACDSQTGHLTRLVMRHGILRAEVATLPAALVARIDDGVLDLTVSAAWLRVWLGLEPGVEVWTNDRVLLGTINRRGVDELVVTAPEGTQQVYVPMAAVERLSQNRLILTADHAQTLLWPAPA